MEIKVSSKYDWETVKKFYNFNNLTRRRGLLVFFVIWFVFMSIPLANMIISGNFTSESAPTLTLFIVLTIAIVFIYIGLPKVRYNKNKIIHNSENFFAFGEDEIAIKSNNQLHNESCTIKYNAIWRIYETKGFIYIFINPNQANIVDKSTVEGGSAMDLRMLLISKIGADKYKIKCKG